MDKEIQALQKTRHDILQIYPLEKYPSDVNGYTKSNKKQMTLLKDTKLVWLKKDIIS